VPGMPLGGSMLTARRGRVAVQFECCAMDSARGEMGIW